MRTSPPTRRIPASWRSSTGSTTRSTTSPTSTRATGRCPRSTSTPQMRRRRWRRARTRSTCRSMPAASGLAGPTPKLQKQGTHPVDLRRDGLARQLLRERAVSGAGSARGLRLRRHAHGDYAGATPDGAAARRPVVRVGAVRMARVPGALGPEGAGDQQRSHWTCDQAAMVGPDRVGRRTSRQEHRATGWADVRGQRRQLLLWRSDRGRNGLELVADPPGAVRGSSAARRGGAAGCHADDDVAPTGSAPPPAA